MRVLVYEYTCGAGATTAPPSLRAEGRAMLTAILDDLGRIPGVEPQSLLEAALAPHGDERQHPEPERARVHPRGVLGDDASGFELAEPFQHGGRRQPDRPDNVYLRFAGVGLQQIEDLRIDGVQLSFGRHFRIINSKYTVRQSILQNGSVFSELMPRAAPRLDQALAGQNADFPLRR